MKSNIIIFNPDQFRTDGLKHMGNEGAYTPNLDKLVKEEAISFSNAFCQNPVCTPSRCSFMSGWYPHVRGHRTMRHMLHSEAGEESLLRILKDDGYNVWWGGKNDLIPGQNGYQADCNVKFQATEEDHKRWKVGKSIDLHKDTSWRGKEDSGDYFSFYAGKLNGTEDQKLYDSDWDNITGALEYIENYDESKPFVLYLPLIYPHPPYGVEEPYYSLIDRKKCNKRIPNLHDNRYGSKPEILKQIIKSQGLQDWNEERYEELRATYYAMCARIDHQAGMIIEALKKKNLWDDSMFFFFSDHGDYTGDYGIVEKNQNTFDDSITKVPLIVKLPKNDQDPVQKTGISDALVELIDVSETIYDLTKIDKHYWTFGQSLLPLILGNKIAHREEVHCEGGRLKGESCTKEKEALDRFSPNLKDCLYYPRLSTQQINEPLYHGKATMIRSKNFKYVKRMVEEDEFYDLIKDSDEQINVINDPQYKDEIINLKEHLLEWYQSTCDIVPFLIDDRS
jgi:arylsulfatase A-like enzyme